MTSSAAASPTGTAVGPGLARRHRALSGLGWHYLGAQHLPRQAHEILVEEHVREALVHLNPEIAAQPDRADDVLYRLRAILMGVRTDGLVKANEEFAAWLAGERSMPFGADGEHVTVRLVDLEDVERNQYVVSTQYTVRSGANERRADLVLLVNGVPLVVIEAKTPVRSSQSWFDGATQIHDDYERNVPELFVPNLCSAATEGKDLRYGSIGLPVDLWGPWRADDDAGAPKLERLKRTVSSMLRPSTVLDLLGSYTAYAAGKGKRRAKIVARYQQVEAANRIVERVVAGHPKKGLVWHFQGSGKSLLMLFAARKLRLHPALGNPTVIIVVDRIDLDTQISSTFHAADAPNLEKADSRADLDRLLAQDARKIIITTIFKFGEVDGVLNDRHNIIVLVDEAHRSQEGDLGRKMRRALPERVPVRIDRHPDQPRRPEHVLRLRRRGGRLRLPEPLRLRGVDSGRRDEAAALRAAAARAAHRPGRRAAIDAEYRELTGGLSDLDREQLSKTAARTAVLLKTPERVERICADIAKHFQEKVAPNGFGAQVVTYDRESCVLYKRALDRVLPAEMSDVVMTVNSGEDEYAAYRRDKDAEERLLDRFRDPNDPLKVLIVTSKLLTGFDAPSCRRCIWTSRCATTRCCKRSAARTGRTARPRRTG